MKDEKEMSKRPGRNQKQHKNLLVVLAAVLVIAVVLAGPVLSSFLNPDLISSEQEAKTIPGEVVLENGNLKFAKSDITEKVSIYPYTEGAAYMEVMAVKASDGSIRTALNTCQVCYTSGRGYYEQEGDTLVCQNCGNVFSVDDIEVIKGGCNPIPVMPDVKTEDSEYIIVSADFLTASAKYFEDWKR